MAALGGFKDLRVYQLAYKLGDADFQRDEDLPPR